VLSLLLAGEDLLGVTTIGLVFVGWGIFRSGRGEEADGGALRYAMTATVVGAAVLIGVLYVRP
jgi:hypothetical protein